MVERYLYDPYGKVTVLNGASGAEKDPNVTEWSPDADNRSDWDNEILFCGYWYDAETGLCEVRNRYFNWLLGRWMTTDPIGYVDGMSLYEYVSSSPLARLDPLGEWEKLSDDMKDYTFEANTNDTFSGLIKMANEIYGFNNSDNNWVCIRPLPKEVQNVDVKAVQDAMRAQWGQGRPARCGVYDVGNLVDGWNTADKAPEFRGVVASYVKPQWLNDPANPPIQSWIGSVQVVFYQHSKDDMFGYNMAQVLWPKGENVNRGQGATLAESMRLAAKGGNDPFRNVTLIGHSAVGSVVMTSGPGGGASFGINDLGTNDATSYDDVTHENAQGDNNVLSRFPRICWFRHDAEVRLVGCNTGDMARNFATILRSGARAIGTRVRINTFMDGNNTATVGIKDRIIRNEGRGDFWLKFPPMLDHDKTASDFYARRDIWSRPVNGALR